MPDLSAYKVDLDTPQPNGGRGESPRAAFTKYNGALDALENSVELDSNGQVPMDVLPAGVANGLATLDTGAKVPMAQLPVGSAGGLATLDQNSTLTATQMPASYVALSAAAFGYGQWLQFVTRAANVIYTNSTGRPISIYIAGNTTAANGSLTLFVEGVNAGRSFHPVSGFDLGVNAIVPAGATYVVTIDNVSITAWLEYR